LDKVNDITDAIIGLLAAGFTVRIIYCLIRIMITPEEAEGYKKRMKNAFIFVIIALSIIAVKGIAISYYKGG